MSDKQPERLVRLREVLTRTGVGRSTLYVLIANGKFPKPVSVAGMRISAWSQSAIDEWIQTQLRKDGEKTD